MNETMGSMIARLRKERGMTQEQLAGLLGITYQAVSKWENEVSSPDISALPLLADVFGVSIDRLFGREAPLIEDHSLVPAEPETGTKEKGYAETFLPWPDDDTLHAVLFVGHQLVGHESPGDRLFSRKKIEFQYEGPALNIQCDFALTVNGDVEGSVSAGGDVDCDAVGGNVTAKGDVNCDAVMGSVSAGGDLSGDAMYGSIQAGGDVSCDDVYGNVTAGGDVSCGDVTGSVSAGGETNGGSGLSFRIKI